MDAMLNGKDPATGKGLTDQSIMDNMIAFLMAGQCFRPHVSRSALTRKSQGTKQLPACWASSLPLSYTTQRLMRICRKRSIMS